MNIRSAMTKVASRSVLAVTGCAVFTAPSLAGTLGSAETNQAIFDTQAADAYSLAVRATVWGYPLIRAAQLREKATQPDAPFAPRAITVATAPINRLGHAQQLADPQTRIGVAPNNDTLYSLAFLDTQQGPFLLETPEFGQRYYTFQFGEADSSTLQSYGQSTHGHKMPAIFVTSPNYKGPTPKGALVVRSTQRFLMIAGRILVDGASDLPAVHGLQKQVVLHRWLGPSRLAPTTVTAQPRLSSLATQPEKTQDLLTNLGVILKDWHPTPSDAKLIASFRTIGLTPKNGYNPSLLSAEQRQAIDEGVKDGLAVIAAKTQNFGAKANGWSTSLTGSRFGTDYLLRAAVAMDQIFVVDKQEALYPVAHADGTGALLDGKKLYTLCFAKDDLPPVNAFWSITMYHAKGLLVDNAIKRYSIGDRTPGLRYGNDGSLQITIQHDDPGTTRTANWLPAPEGGFMLMMRLYRPKASATSGQWHPPAVTPITAGACKG
jgi:hypothetical protein